MYYKTDQHRFITANKASILQFRVFFRNTVENIVIFRSYRIIDAYDAETRPYNSSALPPMVAFVMKEISLLGFGLYQRDTIIFLVLRIV